MLFDIHWLTGCSSSGRDASCLIFPFSTIGLNSTTLNFISFSLEFSIHFLWWKKVIKEISSVWQVFPVWNSQTLGRIIRDLERSLDLFYPKRESFMPTAIAHRSLLNLFLKQNTKNPPQTPNKTNTPHYSQNFHM